MAVAAQSATILIYSSGEIRGMTMISSSQKRGDSINTKTYKLYEYFMWTRCCVAFFPGHHDGLHSCSNVVGLLLLAGRRDKKADVDARGRQEQQRIGSRIFPLQLGRREVNSLGFLRRPAEDEKAVGRRIFLC